MRRGERAALVLVGTIALALGIVGILLPLLPTTPFLLLAAACYARGSERLHDWLLNSPVLGQYIRDYRERRAIRLRAKVAAIVTLWLFVGIGIISADAVWLRILLAAIAAGVTVHLLSLRTITTGSPALARTIET
jgi:hypothetical protein